MEKEIVIKISEKDYNNIEPFLNDETINGGFNLFKALEIIKNGTPLQNKPGKWKPRSIDGPGRSLMVYKCSECKKFALYMTDYCPSCGAKMEWRRQNEDNTRRLFK